MFVGDIEKLAEENSNFRKVIFTGPKAQLVVMSIPVAGDIGEETHPETDQMLFVVEGKAEAILDGQGKVVDEDNAVYVPAGTKHNIKNIANEDLKLYTIYAPPQHPDGTIHTTKAVAMEAEREWKA